MPTKAEFVEAIAKSLHTAAGLDNQSTTSVAFNDLNHTLYITSQQNRDYLQILTPKPTTLTWQGNVVAQLPPQPSQIPYYRGYSAPGMKPGISKVAMHPLLAATLAAARKHLKDDTGLEGFLGSVTHVKVVRNPDLFVIKSVDTAGLHGESRIIRFHFLKFVRNFEPTRFDDLDSLDSGKLIRELTKEFKDRYRGRLHMGSSQGACNRCGDYMDELGISYGSTQTMNKKREETWLHPITMTTGATGYRSHNSSAVRLDATGRRLQELKDE
ncbi:MAG TPA: hypothetical protein VF615_08195 [Longimicrobiaceae bacterium]|jgi:hypothetical protein